jgi:hypothetical protein
MICDVAVHPAFCREIRSENLAVANFLWAFSFDLSVKKREGFIRQFGHPK